MKERNVIRSIVEITQVPVSYYKKCGEDFELQSTYPELPYLSSLLSKCPSALFPKDGRTANTKIYEQLLFYGYVYLSETEYLIIGPVIEIPMDNSMAGFLLKKLELPISQMKDLIDYYGDTPHIAIYRFAKIVSLINKVFHDNNLHTKDILPEEYHHKTIDEIAEEPEPPASDGFAQKSREYERILYSFIYTGQYGKMKNFLKTYSYEGDIANYTDSSMRQNKYLVIISTAIAARAAYYGGVNYELAMSKADFFIKKVDKAETFLELYDAHKQMLLFFTKLVSDSKLGKPASAFFYKVQNYINDHLTEKITTAEMAKDLNINRSYLSSQFKEELGTNLVDYINILKIEEAKRLLLTTDHSLIDISNTLCFSSQSYFAQIFKKIVGVTPKEFRENKPGMGIF